MRKIIIAVVCFVLLVGISIAYTEGVGELFKERLKRLTNKELTGFKYEKTPVEGIYQVTVNGNVVYMTRDGYVFIGVLIGPDNENLTEKAITESKKELVKQIDFSYAVKIGNGPHQVIEFVDPDCPFCRRLSEWLDKRADVTRYVFFYPLPMHPDAESKSLYILCSDDPQKTYLEIMRGKDEGVTPSQECRDKAGPILKKGIQFAEMLGIRGTPFLVVDGNIVEGANIPEIERILGR